MEADVRNLAGHILGSDPVVDLGQPQTPRKFVDDAGATRLSLGESVGRNRTDSFMAPHSGSGILTTQRRKESAASEQAAEYSSMTVAVDRRLWENVDVLADIRKQLMVMGLFPSELYRVGEKIEETPLR